MNDPTPRRRFIGPGPAAKPAASKGADLDEIIGEIDALVGMDAVKSQLNQIIALGRVIKRRRDHDLPTNNISLHMVFMGPPGTGKTEVARKIGKLLKAIGLLKTGDVHEVDRSKLVGGYMGQAAIKSRAAFEAAIGGVLFIDEAYTLSGGTSDTAGADAYGEESITTLLKLMEDFRDRIVVIAAGYTDEMERFLKTNPGLNSRFAKKLRFDSYNADELFEILKRMAKREGYVFLGDAEKEAGKAVREMAQVGSKDPKFGNARDVRSLFERIVLSQAERIGYDDEFDNLPEAERKQRLCEITEEDVHIAAGWAESR